MGLGKACLGLALAIAPQGAQAAADAGVAKDILMRSVAYRTVQGAGQVPKLAAYYADILKKAGFADADVVITPMGETATFAATIKGRDAALKPLLMIGHMDVVEADPKDWTRDPFVPVEENGYIFGRGAEDNKYDVAMMVATLAQLKKEGWRPRRTVTLLLSGDEETDMATTRALASQYQDAEMLLNG
ncbi:MAG: M20/M25/M40 family metallo-hydrolase, partial [Pseudomonadota bacterium]|nr:M20/M25/M40 family metallo-hydrolase [Pseudomonadota bacterium]